MSVLLSVREVRGTLRIVPPKQRCTLGISVAAHLDRVEGATFGEAMAKLKGRCFIYSKRCTGALKAALFALGQPDVNAVRLTED